MSVIQYVVRDSAGIVQRGAVEDSNSNNANIALAQGDAVSLNLRPSDVANYARSGDDLILSLGDGREIVLNDYFNTQGQAAADLYLTQDGILYEVGIDPVGNVSFQEAATWGKWSELDALTFPNDPVVQQAAVADAADAAVNDALVADAGAGGFVGATSDSEVASQGIGLGLGLGGLGGSSLGALGLGAAAVAGGAMALDGSGAGGSGAGGGGTRVDDPTVDRPNATYQIGGDDALMVEVTGTAEPGARVAVQIGDETVTVTANANGIWRARFSGESFPEDGSYEAVVTVTNPNGSVVVLDGPSVVIDTVAPDVDAGGNDGMGGDWINAEAADDGLTIEGTGEPGAEITVEVEGVTRQTTVGDDGTWSVHFEDGVLPGGEYATDVTVTATDAFGNQSVRTESIAIDTVAPELDFDPIEGDNLANAAERADGIVVSGTSEPGATLVVSYDGASYETVAGVDGNWSVTFAATDFAEGEYDAVITAVATDRAGNATTTTSTLHIDTEGSVTIEPGTDGGEPVVNTENSGDGVELTGNAEPGSTVTVVYDGESYDAEVDADGSWTVTVPAQDVTDGEYDVDVTVTATDAAGNTSTTTSTVTVDTETRVTVDTDYAGADRLIGADEADAGVTFTGSTEAGASVEVEFEGSTHTTTAGADGSWSVTFPPAEIPEGDYDGTLNVTVTDLAGNSASESMNVPVDTTAFVAFSTDPVETDGTVNAAEASDGVVLTGATFPGSVVNVTDGTHSYTATVAADGTWSVTVPAADLPGGETEVSYTANAVSASGNSSSSTMTVTVDTVTSATLDAPFSADNVINGAEHDAGVTFTGQAEPGSSVNVTLSGATVAASVAADGTWSATFSAADVPQGEVNAPISVTATDAAGNSTTLTETVAIDTTTGVTADAPSLGGDGVLNAVETAGGITLSGNAEPGASVNVTFNGQTRPAVVAADGTWSVDWPAAHLPSGESTQTVQVTATDAVGNSATTTTAIEVDTLVRDFTGADAPELSDGVIAGPERAGGMAFSGTTEPGASVTVQIAGSAQAATVQADGSWSVTFPEGSIPTGEYTTTLTTSTTDQAGNVSTVSESVRIDTEAGALTLSAEPIEIDDVVNAAEHADGVTVMGTATPGMTVSVGFGTATTTTVAAPDGSWSATFPTGDIPPGTWDASISASITDAYGNTRAVSDSVRIDTEVTNFTTDTPVTADNIISGAEAANGVTLAGSVEPGSVVSVRLGMVTRSATVAADG
ncbi:MAG TPA: BapA prefix-like domain-containing protein, partial [Rhodobacterales bacterium]|nr:BapA prefix-like domain-containing protein [Rhodobacterales bacterium]